MQSVRLSRHIIVSGLLFGLTLSVAIADNPTDTTLASLDLAKPDSVHSWYGWSPQEEVKVNRIKLNAEEYALSFSVSAEKTYNTPMLDLTPMVPVVQETVLEFTIKSPVGGVCHINLTDHEENAWYVSYFYLEANKWVTFRRYLKDAHFKKRLGEGNHHKNGLFGDHLRRVQIATQGRTVLLKDFRIYNARHSIEELPHAPKLMEAPYKPIQYDVLQRGGVFPYGAFLTVKAGNVVNGRYFKQTGRERFENDLVDIKRHYMNTILNGCDESYLDVGYRLDLMSKHHLYLIETALANWDLKSLPRDHQYLRLLKEFSRHEKLLAWYGKDEPSDCRKYLENKLQMNQYGPEKPSTSALCNSITLNALGPYMEVVMPNVYPVTPELKDTDVASKLIAGSAAQILRAKEKCAGKRVWYINQGFSLRRPKNNILLRYPTPVEVRFDIYNAIVAGADGVIFFIYNDTVSYLDGVLRSEEFDETLVDAWGNGYPTYDEVADIGKKIVPVMPSLLGARPIHPYEEKPQQKLVTATLQNELGKYIILANTDLKHANQVKITIACEGEEQVFELFSLKQVKTANGKAIVNLQPGDGAILMIATPANIKTISDEIQSRRLQTDYEMAELEVQLMKRAGFNTKLLENALQTTKDAIDGGTFAQAGKQLETIQSEILREKRSNAAYSEMKALLDRIKTDFGTINSLLTHPKVIVKIDATSTPAWKNVFDNIKQDSITYFQLLREWKNGDFARSNEAKDLQKRTNALRKRTSKMVRVLKSRK